MRDFATDIEVRFQHCDPAGIVFYPRYFEMINQAVETWFAEALDRPFAVMHMHERRGVPVVAIDIRFTAPSRLGDVLTFAIAVNAVGASSFKVDVTATGGGTPRLAARMTLAWVDLDSMKPARLPDDLRAAMQEAADAEPAPLTATP